MKTTIRDVARQAGVSVATVSRVLNDSGPVHKDTRERVRTIARKLRYAPNVAARSLTTRRTQTIGALLPDLYGDFFSEVIRGIDQTAQRHGFHLLVSSSHGGANELVAALRAMHGRVDGLVVMTPRLDRQALAANLPGHLPVVLINTVLDGSAFISLSVDNFGGAFRMTQHLLSQGHHRIAMIRGADKNYDAEERLRGYRDALRAAGIEPEVDWELEGDFTEAAGHRAVGKILKLNPRPTAIFAANDSTAIGALSALREAGLAVPQEMSVVGFDDIPMARYVSPPLSSVHVAINELGEHATEKLLGMVKNGSKLRPSSEMLEATLVIRQSCGAPPEEGALAPEAGAHGESLV